MARISRMSPDDRFEAVASFIEGIAAFTEGADQVPVLNVTYRPRRVGERRTERLEVMGVARSDNGTSFGELVTRPGHQYRLYCISLANLDALETP